MTLALIAIAGIVTPLGLYEALVPLGETPTQFQYVRDTSPMGYGTPPRSSLGFSRKCGSRLPERCPGSETIITFSKNGSHDIADLPFGYDTHIPQSVVDLYSSGTSEKGTTVSNIFDIQWRQYYSRQDDRINNGSRFLAGSFRQVQSMVLDDAVGSVEGLIVDVKNGGIGFRNHTAPVGFGHGATWTEELLFIEPETQCVDTNLTLDFGIKDFVPDNFTGQLLIHDLRLTDRGGLVNLKKKYPFYNRDDIQANPDLRGRAYAAAWMTNALTMAYFNITRPAPNPFSYLNSSIGSAFPLEPEDTDYAFDALTISADWHSFLNLYAVYNTTRPPNPFGITSGNFTDIDTICRGAGSEDIANITNIAVSCGLVYGAPRRRDGSPSLNFDMGSEWTIPLYSCATAVKGTVKTVDLQMNGTRVLDNLKVLALHDKSYSSPADLPLWGVEDSGMAFSSVHPLWGIVSPSSEGRQNLSTVRKQSLYLPGFTSGTSIAYDLKSVQNLPGVEFYSDAMPYGFGIGIHMASKNRVTDYSGRSNMAMYAKWQDLSRKPESTARIINLLWTDIAANSVVGTRDVLGPAAAAGSAVGADRDKELEALRIPVRPIVRRIRYRYAFAVPAFVVAFLTLLICTATVVAWVLGRCSVKTMRRHLELSSTGRLLTTLLYAEDCDLKIKRKEWVKGVGGWEVDLSGEAPVGRGRGGGGGSGSGSGDGDGKGEKESLVSGSGSGVGGGNGLRTPME